MKTRNAIAIAAAGVGVGLAAAGLHRSTHPTEAKGPLSPDPGRRRTPPPDDLFDLPADVIHHRVDTPDGGTIHAIEKGEGRPLVLLHGITLRSDVWAPQFHQLTDRYRVIAVDLRGHGESAVGADGLGIHRLAQDLATLLSSLDLHDAVLVGHSMGGMTVMQFCGLHPDVLADRVAGLVFLATASHESYGPLIDNTVRSVVARGQAVVESGRPLPPPSKAGMRSVRLVFGDRPSKKAIALVGDMAAELPPAVAVPSFASILEHDAREALRATDTPALVVVGTRDILTPVWAGRTLARTLPDAEFVVLPRAGHQLMQERPDEVAELIDAFVARIEGIEPSVAAAVADDDGPLSSDQVEPAGDQA
jgi:pimeloyl-ACP methyl ester carboxylesterase